MYAIRNYENLYNLEYEDTFEERVEAALRDNELFRYRVKTIRSGDMLECEIYPLWNTRGRSTRASRMIKSREAQKNLNDKNAKKHLIRLLNANFDRTGSWATYTYSDENLPKTFEEAERNIINLIRRIGYFIKKNNLGIFKYAYSTEFEEDEKKGKIRVHHHLVTNFYDRDILEQKWNGGGRTQSRRLQPDDFGLEGMARYIAKDPKGKKRFVCSRNLKKPIITIADKKISKRKASEIVRCPNSAPEFFKKLYKGYKFNDINAKFSDHFSGCYIYVRMKKE